MNVYRLQAGQLRVIGKKIGSECDVFCDEFMSVITLYYLQKMIVRIQRESSKNILLSFGNRKISTVKNTIRKVFLSKVARSNSFTVGDC